MFATLLMYNSAILPTNEQLYDVSRYIFLRLFSLPCSPIVIDRFKIYSILILFMFAV